jgi:hypothetical protein
MEAKFIVISTEGNRACVTTVSYCIVDELHVTFNHNELAPRLSYSESNHVPLYVLYGYDANLSNAKELGLGPSLSPQGARTY